MNIRKLLSASVCMLAGTIICASTLSSAQGSNGGPTSADKKFVQAALEGGTAEVQLGQLALQKGSSEDVKQFGQTMVDDHTKLGDQIRQVAQKEGIAPASGTSMKDKALAAKLKTLSGDSFDKAYIEAMVRDHRQDLSDFKKEANAGGDSRIKDAASQGVAVIANHLKIAEQIAKSHNVSVGQ
jgi:putative membrane protein